MPELTLVRHAATALNEQHRYQGRSDPPLSEAGRRQALLLGRRLQGRVFDRVVCSAAARCTQTVALALPGVSSTIDPRWRELDFGEWEELTHEQCAAAHPERLRAWIEDPALHAPPGGESLEALRQRVDRALAELPAGDRVLVITHGGPIRHAVARALGAEWRHAARMRISACGITRLSLYPDGGYLLALNETGHLEP